MPESIKKAKKAVSLIFFRFCLGALALAGLFCSPAKAGDSGLMISEILLAASEDSKQEFIELYNGGSEAVDLAGWTLKKKTAGGMESNLVSGSKMAGVVLPGAYFVIAPPDYAAVINADQLYSGASYAIAANNTVLLYDQGGLLADKVGWGEAGDFAGSPAPNPPADFSLNRPQMINTNDNAADFRIGLPSPGEPYDESSEYIDPATGAGQTEVSTSSAAVKKGQEKLIPAGAVVINEIVADPADDEKQWIELFNRGREAVDLSGWYIELDSGARTYLKGSIGLDEDNFTLVTDLAGTLKLRGGLVSLRLKNGTLIDQLPYGDLNDAYISDNAPIAPYPASLARWRDGQRSSSPAWDWAATFAKTPGSPNIIADKSGLQVPAPLPARGCDLRLSEVLPFPGADEEEFIEAENFGQSLIRLDGYFLENQSRQAYFLSGQLNPGARTVLYREESELALLNDGDTLLLYGPDGGLCQVLAWPAAEMGRAWAYDRAGLEFTWTLKPSPSAANIIVRPNRPPVAAFNFSAPELGRPILFSPADSFDPDGDELSYQWDFGDGFRNILPEPEHTFFRSGSYQASLTVSDGELQASSSREIIIPAGAPELVGESKAASSHKSKTVLITEVLPNPSGTDAEGEWVELTNFGAEPIRLLGWGLSNQSGDTYELPDISLDPDTFIVLRRPESQLALPNAGGAIRLLDPEAAEIASTTYGSAKEGYSWSRDEDGQWHWTKTVSPGQENVIVLAASSASPAKSAQAKSAAASNGAFSAVDLSEVKNLPLGAKIETSGLVSVRPGVFGKQFFYIAGAGGLQVYSYKQDFPDLAIGDRITVRGELSQNQGELRLKTQSRSDIIWQAHAAAPSARPADCASVGADDLGQLLSIAGEVVESKSGSLYLDDGQDEIMVYIKAATGINPRAFAEGDRIRATGILASAQSGLRLLPRQPEDIERLDASGNASLADSAKPAGMDPEAVQKRKAGYIRLLAAFGLLTAALSGYYFLKNRKKTA